MWCVLIPMVPVAYWIDLDYETSAQSASF